MSDSGLMFNQVGSTNGGLLRSKGGGGKVSEGFWRVFGGLRGWEGAGRRGTGEEVSTRRGSEWPTFPISSKRAKSPRLNITIECNRVGQFTLLALSFTLIYFPVWMQSSIPESLQLICISLPAGISLTQDRQMFESNQSKY